MTQPILIGSFVEGFNLHNADMPMWYLDMLLGLDLKSKYHKI